MTRYVPVLASLIIVLTVVSYVSLINKNPDNLDSIYDIKDDTTEDNAVVFTITDTFSDSSTTTSLTETVSTETNLITDDPQTQPLHLQIQ